MRADFCIFILTHGRPNLQKTYKTIVKEGCTYPIYFLIDNEDKTAPEYYKLYGNSVVMFDKPEESLHCDSMDNFNDRRVILYARNACFEQAKKLGYKYFLELDDDYTYFGFRRPDEKIVFVKHFNNCCDSMIDWLETSGSLSVAFFQAGDMIGGATNSSFLEGFKRKAMNTFFCSVDRPFKFSGRINEDVNAYTTLGSRGGLFLQTSGVIMNQTDTQESGGGMTDIYKLQGTYVKSFYTVMCMPSCVKISTIGTLHIRIHHHISWNNCVPKILPEEIKKARTL